jgi:hypothetical protein
MLARFLPDFWRCLDLEIIREKMRNICNGSWVSKDSSLADSPLRRDAEIPIVSTLRAQISSPIPGSWISLGFQSTLGGWVLGGTGGEGNTKVP